MSLFLHQLRGEQRLYWRSRELAFFTFLFPIIFLVLLGSAYGNDTVDGVRGYTYLLSGLLGYPTAARTRPDDQHVIRHGVHRTHSGSRF